MKTETKERKMMTVEYKMLRDLRKEMSEFKRKVECQQTITFTELDVLNKEIKESEEIISLINETISNIKSHISTTPKKKFKLTN